MKAKAKIEQMIMDSIVGIEESILECNDNGCKSPIESVLATAIQLTNIQDCANGADPIYKIVDAKTSEELKSISGNFLDRVVISRQIPIGKYKVDFLAVSTFFAGGAQATFMVVVECDGHDWHEKTKEQAAHDKARDRYFSINGYGVLRFTGSEIWDDANSCVEDIKEYFNTRRSIIPWANKIVERTVGKTWDAVRDEFFDEGFKAGVLSRGNQPIDVV